MVKATEALLQSARLAPQVSVGIQRGLTVRRTQQGVPVVRIHYSAHPERDPDMNPEWKAKERKLYTSEASWQREQEIVDEAGGGELVFADSLISNWNLIVITAPEWKPDPRWDIFAGFDHGKT